MSKIYDALQKASDPHRDPEPHGGERAPSEPGPAPVPAPAAPGIDPVSPESEGPSLSDDFSRELSTLRAGIEQIFPDSAPRSLLFAGSVPGEGASTVAARFAQLLAHDPRLKVSLIDADFRNGEKRVIEPAERGAGLASVLAGRISVSQAVKATTMGRLDVLPSEGVFGNVYQVCSEEHVAPLLAALQQKYHYTLLDAAPVLSAPETPVLSGLVDGVVVVVRAGRTKREIVRRSLDLLRKYHARVLGVVMNRQQYVIPEFIYRRL